MGSMTLLGVGRPALVASTTTLNFADMGSGISLDGTNLIATKTAINWTSGRSIGSASTGKYYFEGTCVVTPAGAGSPGIGVANSTFALTTHLGNDAGYNSWGFLANDGTVYRNGGGTAGIPGTWNTAGAVAACAVDLTARLIWFRVIGAGTWNNNGGDPAAGSGGSAMGGATATGAIFAGIAMYGNAVTPPQVAMNFGATAYAGTPPTGFGNLS